MGLFSFLNKNKQETSAEDSGYFSRDDDAAATRARSKRASSAGEPAARRGKEAKGDADPVLPEKKRARRRLVGAIALALAVAVGLPMVLDSEPKPLASDISIQIPPREKAAPLPQPAAPAPAAAVAPADSLDQREQLVEAPKTPAAPAPAAAPDTHDVKTVSIKPDTRALEPTNVAKAAKAEPKPAEAKPAETKPAETKPAAAAKPAQTPDDAARALAILEGKPRPLDVAGQKYVVQVAALASQEKVNELQGKLKDAGIKSTTQKVTGKAGDRIRITVGPFSKEEADKMRARLDKLGLSGSMVRPHG